MKIVLKKKEDVHYAILNAKLVKVLPFQIVLLVRREKLLTMDIVNVRIILWKIKKANACVLHLIRLQLKVFVIQSKQYAVRLKY